MNNYTTEKHIAISEDIQLYLLNVSKNITRCDKSIIPKSQAAEISRYRLKQDVDKRILARTFLYEYLFDHYGLNDFELDFNEYEKPFLKAAPNVNFSFSYAKDYVLVGISKDKKLGVDIEYINPTLNLEDIAPEIMCPAELREFNLYSRNPVSQRIYFFNLFSVKESIIKSFGTGLYFDVKNLNIFSGNEYCYMDVKFVYLGLDSWMNQYTLALCYEK